MYGISCMTWKQKIKNTFEQSDPKFQYYSIKRDSIQDFPGGPVVDSMLPMQGVVGVTPGGEDSACYVVKKREREQERDLYHTAIYFLSLLFIKSPLQMFPETQLKLLFIFFSPYFSLAVCEVSSVVSNSLWSYGL